MSDDYALVVGRALRRSAADTWSVATLRGLALSVVVAAAGLGSVWSVEGTKHAVSQAWLLTLSAVLPVVVLWLSVFLWNLWKAPGRLRAEDQAAEEAAEQARIRESMAFLKARAEIRRKYGPPSL